MWASAIPRPTWITGAARPGRCWWDYANAARENLLGLLAEHDDASLGATEMTNRQGAAIKLADMFRMLLWEVNQHGGQASYLRGMQRGLNQ